MPETAILVTLVVYKLVLLGIGFWAARRNRDGADFYLGGRGLGPWVASISAAASSSSAWALLGVTGLAYTHGLGALWIAPACIGGFALNWYVVAKPLQAASRESGAVTLTDLLARDAAPAHRRAVVVSASLITLVCLGGYVASQFLGAGKTFVETFDMSFESSVLLGGAVILVYTMVGGFWAVSITDTLQGLVMAGSALAVPLVGIISIGGPGELLSQMGAIDPLLLDPFRGMGLMAAAGLVIGSLGIGLGYPGQPHVVNRFMALRDEKALKQGRRIAMTWAAVTYTGVILAGCCARVLLDAGVADSEGAMIGLTKELFPPVLAGVILAAVLSAIMSTADSQLLVCSSTVAHDLSRTDDPQRELRRGRIAVIVVSILAMLLAITVDESIFDTVLFAWSGLGAAFGPIVIIRAIRGPIPTNYLLAAMWAGFLVSAVWFLTPLKAATDLYELIPAFGVAWVIAWLGAARAKRS